MGGGSNYSLLWWSQRYVEKLITFQLPQLRSYNWVFVFMNPIFTHLFVQCAFDIDFPSAICLLNQWLVPQYLCVYLSFLNCLLLVLGCWYLMAINLLSLLTTPHSLNQSIYGPPLLVEVIPYLGGTWVIIVPGDKKWKVQQYGWVS